MPLLGRRAGRKTVAPFGSRQDKALIVSPFISTPVVRDFLDRTARRIWYPVPMLQELPQETLQRCKASGFWRPNLLMNPTMKIRLKKMKCWTACTRNSRHRSWLGREHLQRLVNATTHALQHNVEFMVNWWQRKAGSGWTSSSGK